MAENEKVRTASIQRMHSQEMALRLLAIIGFDAEGYQISDKNHEDVVRDLTDWFELDIRNAVALRSNGKVETVPADESVKALTLDEAMRLEKKIKSTPKELHPMIQVKMTSLGCGQTKNLLQAIGAMSPTNATLLEDHIDSLVDQN